MSELQSRLSDVIGRNSDLEIGSKESILVSGWSSLSRLKFACAKSPGATPRACWLPDAVSPATAGSCPLAPPRPQANARHARALSEIKRLVDWAADDPRGSRIFSSGRLQAAMRAAVSHATDGSPSPDGAEEEGAAPEPAPAAGGRRRWGGGAEGGGDARGRQGARHREEDDEEEEDADDGGYTGSEPCISPPMCSSGMASGRSSSLADGSPEPYQDAGPSPPPPGPPHGARPPHAAHAARQRALDERAKARPHAAAAAGGGARDRTPRGGPARGVGAGGAPSRRGGGERKPLALSEEGTQLAVPGHDDYYEGDDDVSPSAHHHRAHHHHYHAAAAAAGAEALRGSDQSFGAGGYA